MAGTRPDPSLEGFLEIQAERYKTGGNLGGGGGEKPNGWLGTGQKVGMDPLAEKCGGPDGD